MLHNLPFTDDGSSEVRSYSATVESHGTQSPLHRRLVEWFMPFSALTERHVQHFPIKFTGPLVVQAH